MTDASGKARFKKLQISVQADIGDDDPDKAYQALSEYIENMFCYEANLK